ncbi:MAG: helix-turn-helix transcriptional regulator [Bacteroidota bacterium]
MTSEKRKKLEAAGWRMGSAVDFLDLTPEEAAYVELKLSLSRGLRERRTREGLTQAALARRIGSSQSRVAKAEASDPGVSMDLLIRALLATGATPKDVARLMDRRKAA